MTYEYSDDSRHVILKDGRYAIFQDLKFVGDYDGIRPYIRSNTKIDIYRDYRENHPEMYNNLRKQDWFEPYLEDVENKVDVIVPNEVSRYLKETKKIKENGEPEPVDNTPEIFQESISLLADKISDMSANINAMNTNTKLEQALIDGIVEKGSELAVEDIKKQLEADLDDYIKETYGVLPDKMIIAIDDVEYETTGLYHEQFENVLKLVKMKLPVMLTGGAGTGKNFMMEQVAEALDLGFYYTSTITQEYKLTGFIDGGGSYHETEFYKAFTEGGVFMLDEIDASIPDALVILNGAIANGYFDFPIGREFAHEDFRVVSAGNTVGLGADMVYTGRNVLDGATLDRFVLVEMDYDNRIEERICQDEELRDFLYDIRKSVTKNKINHVVGMRAFKYSYEMLVNGFDKEFIINSVIMKGVLQDDLNIIEYDMHGDSEWYEIMEGMSTR